MTTPTHGSSGNGSLDAETAAPQSPSESSCLMMSRKSYSFCSELGDGIHKSHHSMDGDEDPDCYRSTWKEYFVSWRFVELLVCVIPFLAVYVYFETRIVLPRMRRIPFQRVYGSDGTGGKISSNGDDEFWGYQTYANVIWNPLYTEMSVGDTISHQEYQILTGLCPWILQLLLVWFLDQKKNCCWDSIHKTTCMYCVGIGATDAISNCLKHYVGYLRPVFLDICQPYYDETDSSFHCADEDAFTHDARMSFPSNHSGWSFCGMMLLSMYLERRFGLGSIRSKKSNAPDGLNSKRKQIIQERNQQARYRLISLLCFLPMLFAFYVAASRLVDNRHFPADVVGGAVLGGSIAIFVFGLWFP